MLFADRPSVLVHCKARKERRILIRHHVLNNYKAITVEHNSTEKLRDSH